MTALPKAPETVAAAFLAACRAELTALKPGNVHIHAPGHDMEADHFERAAVAAAPALAEPGASVGRRVRRAVEASLKAAGCNTNLGILLLCAPLALAAEDASLAGSCLRERLAGVLSRLDHEDAADVFAAIALANPGGLGNVDSGDVGRPPNMALIEAMRLASGRDRIARAYVTDFEDIFAFALPAYRKAQALARSPDLAVTTLHVKLLAAFPDTHIARKFGDEAAGQVQAEAVARLPDIAPVAHPDRLPDLAEFDASLKARRFNPGTTADFVVATLFTTELCGAGC